MSKKVSTFLSRLNYLLEREGQTGTISDRANFLATTFRVTRPAARKWLTDQGLPKTETLIEMADFFHVSLDYLFGRHDMESMAVVFDSDNQVFDSPGAYFKGAIRESDKLIVRPLRDKLVSSETYYLIDFLGVRQIMQITGDENRIEAVTEDANGRRAFEIHPAAAVSHFLGGVIGEVLGVIRVV
jgi:transcriptional regulator with XRE-family HTH domain